MTLNGWTLSDSMNERRNILHFSRCILFFFLFCSHIHHNRSASESVLLFSSTLSCSNERACACRRWWMDNFFWISYNWAKASTKTDFQSIDRFVSQMPHFEKEKTVQMTWKYQNCPSALAATTDRNGYKIRRIKPDPLISNMKFNINLPMKYRLPLNKIICDCLPLPPRNWWFRSSQNDQKLDKWSGVVRGRDKWLLCIT